MGMRPAAIIAAFLPWFCAANLSNADDGTRRYAALSLIGETMTVVSYVGTTGSQLSGTRREPFSIGSRFFDTVALNAVQRSLQELDVQAPLATFFGTSPELFTEQEKLFDGRRVVLSPDLTAAMKKERATHLFIITRYRSDAEIRMQSGTTGSGMLEGVGYYLDKDLPVMSWATGGSATGYIAPYVYLRISLVDLAASAIERERFITWSVALSAASFAKRSEGSTDDPRTVLAGKHVPVLGDALVREVSRAMPYLVGEDACGGDEATVDDRLQACSRAIASGKLAPNELARAYKTRAVGWTNKRDPDRAIADLNEAIRLDPRYALAYNNRGDAWSGKRDNDRAIADYGEAIRLSPQFALAYFHRGNAWRAKRNNDRAIADYSEAIRLNLQYPTAYNNRGNAWLDKGDKDRAIADYSEAIRMNPRYLTAYQNRARAWQARRELGRALADHESAVEIQPDNPYVLNNIAWFLAVVSEDPAKGAKRAVDYARRASELRQWKDANTLDTLAAAYAAAGDFPEAIRWEEKALEDPNFAKTSGRPARARLELYRAGKPYRAE